MSLIYHINLPFPEDNAFLKANNLSVVGVTFLWRKEVPVALQLNHPPQPQGHCGVHFTSAF